MSSNIELTKTCICCGESYIAKTLYTRYCSHICNRRHYKKLKADVASTDQIEKQKPSPLTSGEYNGQQDLPDQKTIDSYNLEVFYYERERNQYQKDLKEKIKENLED